jgi:V/A-type H+-transporting ATPase subunit E
VGYPELLRVLGEEAEREARELRDAAEREHARILDEARAAAGGARDALLSRERAALAAQQRAAAEALAIARDQALLLAARRVLEELRAEILARLRAEAGPRLDARLLAEVLPEAGDGPLEILVDPGAEDACVAALARLGPDLRGRATVRAAPQVRGGVEVVAGRRVLDDTLPSRLERAWPGLEPELARVLFGEG